MSLIAQLNQRYAVKKFDDTKKISPEQLDLLLSAVQLAPSSFGLQHYRVLVIEDHAIREKLREAAFGQQQITQASQLIVFAAETHIDEAYGKKFIDLVAKTRHTPREQLAGFESYLLGALSSKSDAEKITWAHKQAYIALGVLVTAAAEQGIDICPMEGFIPEKFDEILGLKEIGLTSSVIATIGYRAEDDVNSKFAKVRKPMDELFIHI